MQYLKSCNYLQNQSTIVFRTYYNVPIKEHAITALMTNILESMIAIHTAWSCFPWLNNESEKNEFLSPTSKKLLAPSFAWKPLAKSELSKIPPPLRKPPNWATVEDIAMAITTVDSAFMITATPVNRMKTLFIYFLENLTLNLRFNKFFCENLFFLYGHRVNKPNCSLPTIFLPYFCHISTVFLPYFYHISRKYLQYSYHNLTNNNSVVNTCLVGVGKNVIK